MVVRRESKQLKLGSFFIYSSCLKAAKIMLIELVYNFSYKILKRYKYQRQSYTIFKEKLGYVIVESSGVKEYSIVKFKWIQ